MAIFNLSNFNFGNAFIRVLENIVPSSYEGIKIYGSGNFARIYGVNYIYTQAEIDELDGNQPFPDREWTVDTFIWAQFLNNLQAGNITSLPAPLDGWKVQRQGKNESKFATLGELGSEETEFVDRLAKSKESYIYRVIPKTGDVLGSPLDSDIIDTSFKKIVLLDPDTQEGYSFCLDLRMSDIQIDEDVTYKDTRGKYQTELRGNKKVNNGSIGFLAKSSAVDSTELEQDLAYLQAFEDFINNGQPKILKIDNGYIYKVATSNFGKQRRNSVNNNGETLFNLAFNWREIGEVI